MTLICLAVSLFPLALYLFFLSGLNRRDHPVLLHGLWEVLALFFALSGFLLWTGPQLMKDLYEHELAAVPLEQDSEGPFEDILFKWRVIWMLYYLAVVTLAAMFALGRWRHRGIYNVDMEGFREGLIKTLDEAGVTSRAEGSTLYLYPASAPPAESTSDTGSPTAVLAFEVFPAFRTSPCTGSTANPLLRRL